MKHFFVVHHSFFQKQLTEEKKQLHHQLRIAYRLTSMMIRFSNLMLLKVFWHRRNSSRQVKKEFRLYYFDIFPRHVTIILQFIRIYLTERRKRKRIDVTLRSFR